MVEQFTLFSLRQGCYYIGASVCCFFFARLLAVDEIQQCGLHAFWLAPQARIIAITFKGTSIG